MYNMHLHTTPLYCTKLLHLIVDAGDQLATTLAQIYYFHVHPEHKYDNISIKEPKVKILERKGLVFY